MPFPGAKEPLSSDDHVVLNLRIAGSMDSCCIRWSLLRKLADRNGSGSATSGNARSGSSGAQGCPSRDSEASASALVFAGTKGAGRFAACSLGPYSALFCTLEPGLSLKDEQKARRHVEAESQTRLRQIEAEAQARLKN